MAAHLLRRALESALVSPFTPPETDEHVMLFRTMFPGFANNTHNYTLEERTDGQAEDELEHTIYARVTNFDELKGAISMEHHDQWEIKVPKTAENAGKGSLRSRKTWIDGSAASYSIVLKIAVSDEDKKEIPFPANESAWIAFKFLSTAGMIKDRYHFPVVGSDLVWEVDMFPKEGGGYHEWCKIDLEVKDLDAPLPEFPIALDDVILPKRFGKMDEAQWDEKVTKLYDEHFITKNAFVSGLEKKKIDAVNEDTDEAGTPEVDEPDPVSITDDPSLNTTGGTPTATTGGSSVPPINTKGEEEEEKEEGGNKPVDASAAGSGSDEEAAV